MGVRSYEPETAEPFPPAVGPRATTSVLLALVVFLLLVSNGRPIGAGDTRPTERVAASLLREGDFDLDEFEDVEEPFARTIGGRRVSIYPVASAILAVPVFGLGSALFALDETGLALCGKAAASLFSAVAAALFFAALARRHPHGSAAGCAFVLALGTSVWSTSQSLWQHPLAVLAVCGALLCMVRAEDDPAWAGRAGLPLALAVAARQADVALAAVLALGIAVRWPRRIPWMALWGVPVAVLVLLYQGWAFGSVFGHGFAGGLRFTEPWGQGHLGLLLSPGKGLLVFTPVVAAGVFGMVEGGRRGQRWWVATLGGAALAHWLLMGRWAEWHGGEAWGPRMMTDAVPLLLFFLPEALDRRPRVTVALATVSIAVQALGAFTYDYQWERLRQRPVSSEHPELWDVPRSPIAFYASRRLVYLALPARHEGRVVVKEHPVVLGGPRGSRVRFAGERVKVEGSDAAVEDVHLQRGARVVGDRAQLAGRWDGVFLRVAPEARARRLELRIAGSGRGVLYVGERTFWSASTKWAAYPMSGPFRIRHPYAYPESGGGDLTVTLGRSPGEASLATIALVSAGEPEDVIRLP
jgi:hypothetical protein